jgi:hypothetical protein
MLPSQELPVVLSTTVYAWRRTAKVQQSSGWRVTPSQLAEDSSTGSITSTFSATLPAFSFNPSWSLTASKKLGPYGPDAGASCDAASATPSVPGSGAQVRVKSFFVSGQSRFNHNWSTPSACCKGPGIFPMSRSCPPSESYVWL